MMPVGNGWVGNLLEYILQNKLEGNIELYNALS